MLSSVLRSDTAIEVSIRVVDSFIKIRHFVASNAAMFEQIRTVELRQLENQKATRTPFERVFDYMGARKAPKLCGRSSIMSFKNVVRLDRTYIETWSPLFGLAKTRASQTQL